MSAAEGTSSSSAEPQSNAGLSQADADEKVLKAAKLLVRIKPSAYQSYTEWSYVYFALLNYLGKDAAMKLFVEWSR